MTLFHLLGGSLIHFNNPLNRLDNFLNSKKDQTEYMTSSFYQTVLFYLANISYPLRKQFHFDFFLSDMKSF